MQSIMYLRHSNSGGKSASSSVVSLSPTVFTDAPYAGTAVSSVLLQALQGILHSTNLQFVALEGHYK